MTATLMLLLFTLIVKILSQDNPIDESEQSYPSQILILNETTKGRIEIDEGVTFYNVTLPSQINKDNILIVTVTDDRDNIQSETDIFSDPDIYISKVNQYPKTPRSSQWYSQRYGDDIVSITSNFLNANDVFYIGMYCQFKCDFELKAYLASEVKIKNNTFNSYLIKANSSMLFSLSIEKPFKELNIVSTGHSLKDFKMFVSQTSPSSQNTYDINPAWANGYSVSIVKGSKEYCEMCSYKILIQSSKTDVYIHLQASFPELETKIKSTYPVFEAMKESMMRCYNFEVPKNNVEQIIIQMTIFSGTVVMQIGGWNKITATKFEELKYNNYTYSIRTEKVIVLSQNDFNYFGKERKDNYLKMCVFSRQKTSYMLLTYFANHSEELQRYNLISSGNEITSFLKHQQVTRYKLLEFSENSNITLTFTPLEGETIPYVFFCEEENCFFNTSRLDTRLKKKEMILPNKTSTGYEIVLLNSMNKCQIKGTEKQDEKFSCFVLAVVNCIGNLDCIYRIRVSHESSVLSMQPRKLYYNVIPRGAEDSYRIVITDDNIDQIVVVLNTATGDAQLFFYEVDVDDKLKLVDMSLNEDYIPDVVRYTKPDKKSLIGEYQVKVKGDSFSTYSLYYYTYDKNPKFKNPTDDDVFIDLIEGDIVSDIFSHDTKYKIYSFTPFFLEDKEKEDIRIVLTRKNVPFEFRVFLNFSQFSYKEDYWGELIKGYTWACDENNELLIKTTDPNYTTNGTYYIVVYRSTKQGPIVYTNSSYYLGITTESTPFLIYEGIMQSSTLSKAYSNQAYWYYHTNSSIAFSLSLNVFFGSVDIYFSVHKFTVDEIPQIKGTFIAYEENISKAKSIVITPSTLSKFCYKDESCEIFIMIKQSNNYTSQYVIVGKSSMHKGEYLIAGISKTDYVLPGEYQYYIIEDQVKTPGSVLTISFISGYGDVYMRVPVKPEANPVFPNSTYYDIIGKDSYKGKSIVIPQHIINDKSRSQLLISVKGSLSASKEEFKYTIAYSSEPKSINQNTPYRGYIQKGESQYFTFFFEKDAKNIYFSLSNMNGDADLYLNYGTTKPTTNDSDWYSVNTNHEFINLNKDDEYFKEKKITDIGGYYTLLVQGFENTTFTLFASGHDKVIIPIEENTIATCRCLQASDTCYFRFDNFFNGLYESKITEMIFATHYIYGNGALFGKLYKESTSDLLNSFPNATSNDYSNIKSNQRNFMRVKIKDNEVFNQDSVLLLTLECKEKTLVDLNMAILTTPYYGSLDLGRENIFYIKPSDHITTLIFYNFYDKDLQYKLYGYTGEANVLVYLNDTYYNNSTNQYEGNFTHLAKFNLDSNSNKNREYYNSILSSQKTNSKNVYFNINVTSNFGFYIKLNYAQAFTKVSVGREEKYIVTLQRFLGYFDILDEYSQIDLTINLDHFDARAIVYIKTVLIKKSKTEAAQDHIIPDKSNNDIIAMSDSVLGTVLAKITSQKQKQKKDNTQTERVYFQIYLDQDNLNKTHTDEMVTILLTPKINNYKRIDAIPMTYYFSDDTSTEKKEVKVYSLEKMKDKDDFLVIDISTCFGEYEYRISDKIAYDQDTTNITSFQENKNGRKIITVPKLTGKHYYLTIWGKAKESIKCFMDENISNKTCTADVKYMMHYYTTTMDRYNFSMPNNTFEFHNSNGGKVKIKLPRIIESDFFGNIRNIKHIKYDVFISDNETDYENMNSVCFLSQMNPTRWMNTSRFSKDHIHVSNLKNGACYYTNILAENEETKELITFMPRIICVSSSYMSIYISVAGVIIIIGLVILSVKLYRKYKVIKQIYIYEQGDIIRSASVPKSETELAEMSRKQQQQKYINLTEHSSSM